MKLSKSECIVLTYIFDGMKSYIVTKNQTGKYTLYKTTDDDYQKMKTSDTPVEFDKIVEKDRSK